MITYIDKFGLHVLQVPGQRARYYRARGQAARVLGRFFLRFGLPTGGAL